VRANQRETGGAVVERSGVPALVVWQDRAFRRRKSRPRGRVYRWVVCAISSNGIAELPQSVGAIVKV